MMCGDGTQRRKAWEGEKGCREGGCIYICVCVGVCVLWCWWGLTQSESQSGTHQMKQKDLVAAPDGSWLRSQPVYKHTAPFPVF